MTRFVLALLILFGVLFILLRVSAVAGTPEAQPTKVFDHTNSQYPARTTNPPNGCDNSDPACSEQIKGGECDSTKAI